LLRPYCCSRR